MTWSSRIEEILPRENENHTTLQHVSLRDRQRQQRNLDLESSQSLQQKNGRPPWFDGRPCLLRDRHERLDDLWSVD